MRKMDGVNLEGMRISVEFAKEAPSRGPRGGGGDGYRLTVEGLSSGTSWQDLKVTLLISVHNDSPFSLSHPRKQYPACSFTRNPLPTCKREGRCNGSLPRPSLCQSIFSSFSPFPPSSSSSLPYLSIPVAVAHALRIYILAHLLSSMLPSPSRNSSRLWPVLSLNPTVLICLRHIPTGLGPEGRPRDIHRRVQQ